MNKKRAKELLAERDVIEHGDGIHVNPVLFASAPPVTMLELKQLLKASLALNDAMNALPSEVWRRIADAHGIEYAENITGMEAPRG